MRCDTPLGARRYMAGFVPCERARKENGEGVHHNENVDHVPQGHDEPHVQPRADRTQQDGSHGDQQRHRWQEHSPCEMEEVRAACPASQNNTRHERARGREKQTATTTPRCAHTQLARMTAVRRADRVASRHLCRRGSHWHLVGRTITVARAAWSGKVQAQTPRARAQAENTLLVPSVRTNHKVHPAQDRVLVRSKRIMLQAPRSRTSHRVGSCPRPAHVTSSRCSMRQSSVRREGGTMRDFLAHGRSRQRHLLHTSSVDRLVG